MNTAIICKTSKHIIHLLDNAQPIFWFVVRVWIASIFFKSGLTKIDDFETTIFLFAEEYRVPLLSPYFAALSGTFFELAAPVALVLGFMTRAAAVPLLIMTIVIQLTYQEHVQHYYWATALIGIILHGGGKLSADHFILRKCRT